MHMKKVLVCCFFAAQSWLLSAQIFVKGIKIGPDNTGQYLELDPLYKSDGHCTFSVDFGQSEPKQDFVTDVNGRRFDFRSLVDGLNFFYENGWEVNDVSVLESGRRYLLKRRF